MDKSKYIKYAQGKRSAQVAKAVSAKMAEPKQDKRETRAHLAQLVAQNQDKVTIGPPGKAKMGRARRVHY